MLPKDRLILESLQVLLLGDKCLDVVKQSYIDKIDEVLKPNKKEKAYEKSLTWKYWRTIKNDN